MPIVNSNSPVNITVLFDTGRLICYLLKVEIKPEEHLPGRFAEDIGGSIRVAGQSR